jgi:hypothetical protein
VLLSVPLAIALLLGVRHSDRLQRWALSPRTPGRIAAAVVGTVTVVGQAAGMFVLLAPVVAGLALVFALLPGIAA